MLQILQIIIGLASLACFVFIVVKMFQNGDTGIAIACIVGVFICGIGGLIAYVMGWVKSGEYDSKNIMVVWTALIVVGIVVGIARMATEGGMAP